jgi:hypothetical protein
LVAAIIQAHGADVNLLAANIVHLLLGAAFLIVGWLGAPQPSALLNRGLSERRSPRKAGRRQGMANRNRSSPYQKHKSAYWAQETLRVSPAASRRAPTCSRVRNRNGLRP